ncbi:MAG: ParB/RepB/Spo0J family partition protein [Candidatus Rifleibacteriota bacterium]
MKKNELKYTQDFVDNNLEGVALSESESEMNFRFLPLDQVTANPGQPRKVFEKQYLEELAQSIKKNGVLQPILVRQIGNNFQIVSGERRFRAGKMAGLKKIPAVIRKLDEKQTMLAGLIENIQRKDLNPLEEARTLKEILMNHGLTHDQLAERIGRSRSALTNRLRLLQLPSEVQLMIIDGKISPGHAKMLAGMRDSVHIKNWARKIIKEGLSVYETEKQIARSKKDLPANLAKKDNKTKMNADLHIRAVEENLQDLLGAKVRIRQGKAKGRIEIEFYNKQDLERVVESMVSMYL